MSQPGQDDRQEAVIAERRLILSSHDLPAESLSEAAIEWAFRIHFGRWRTGLSTRLTKWHLIRREPLVIKGCRMESGVSRDLVSAAGVFEGPPDTAVCKACWKWWVAKLVELGRQP
jgi:hypothetical protein